MWASGDDNAWAVGTGGTILHWDGSKWSQAAGGAPKDILGLGGAQDGGAYAVGAAGLVAQMGSGGLSGLTVPATGTLNAVVVSTAKPEHSVVVGEGGRKAGVQARRSGHVRDSTQAANPTGAAPQSAP